MEIASWISNFLLAVVIGWFALLSFAAILGKFSEIVGTQEKLEQFITEERVKLGIGADVTICAKLNARGSRTRWDEGNAATFWVEIEGRGTKALVRHEMHHLCRLIHLKARGTGGFIRYLLIEEPLATIYEISGWKIGLFVS